MGVYRNNEKGSVLVAVLVAALVVLAGVVVYLTVDKRQKVVSENPPALPQANAPLNETPTEKTPAPPAPQQPPQGNSGAFLVVDENSGLSVPNVTITANGQQFSSISLFLAYARTLPGGSINISVSAPGYKTMTTDLKIPNSLGITFNLVPLAAAHNCPRHPSNSKGFFLCGYVGDENHTVLSGVQVSSPDFPTVSAQTGRDGYYELEFLPPVVAPNTGYDCGDLFTFTYTKPGYKIHNFIYDGIHIYQNGDGGNKVTLTRGTGSDQHYVKHGMCP